MDIGASSVSAMASADSSKASLDPPPPLRESDALRSSDASFGPPRRSTPHGDLNDALRRRMEENRQRAIRYQRERAMTSTLRGDDRNCDDRSNKTESNACVRLTQENLSTTTKDDNAERGDTFDSVIFPSSFSSSGHRPSEGPHAVRCSMIRQGFPCSEVAEPILFANFGEAVCLRCRSEAEDDFQYVVKEALRNEYLLSDYIIGTMRFITKPNPHNARWAPIKLYLRKQAEAKAVAKWGSMDALREELSLRQRRQFDRSLKKVKAALSGTGSSVDSDAHSDRPESLLSAALSRGGTASLPSNVVPSVPGATDYCGSMVSASDPKSRAKRRRKTSSLDGIAAIIRGDG